MISLTPYDPNPNESRLPAFPTCPFCHREFRSPGGLGSHLVNKHGRTDNPGIVIGSKLFGCVNKAVIRQVLGNLLASLDGTDGEDPKDSRDNALKREKASQDAMRILALERLKRILRFNIYQAEADAVFEKKMANGELKDMRMDQVIKVQEWIQRTITTDMAVLKDLVSSANPQESITGMLSNLLTINPDSLSKVLYPPVLPPEDELPAPTGEDNHEPEVKQPDSTGGAESSVTEAGSPGSTGEADSREPEVKPADSSVVADSSKPKAEHPDSTAEHAATNGLRNVA